VKKSPLKILKVRGQEITVQSTESGAYICLTDMARSFGGEKQVENWIRNKNTIEFLGVWESLNNVNFNSLEFEGIRSASGSNRFVISAKQWISKTNAIGILAKTGRYGGGTFAHEDIALEFASWLSPEFRLYVIKEFKRLKEDEAAKNDLDWSLRRMLAKANYRIHTDAIKDDLLPELKLPKEKEWLTYVDEADLLNYAVFGKTAKEWRAESPDASGNIRDSANIIQLTVLSNIESLNATLIRDKIPKAERLKKLCKVAQDQFKTLSSNEKLANRDDNLFSRGTNFQLPPS
jgi:hypothetical protein